MDDVFSIVKKCIVNNLLAHLNRQHPAMRFAADVETDGHLPFLDTDVNRLEGRLVTSVYQKPTHTGSYLSFDSNYPESANRSVGRASIS